MLPRTTVDELLILTEAHSSGYTVHTEGNEYKYIEISKRVWVVRYEKRYGRDCRKVPSVSAE